MAGESLLSLLSNKKIFLLKVYGILIFQLIITFGIIYEFRNHPLLSNTANQSVWLYLILLIFILLVMMFLKMPMWLKFIFFCMFTVFTGALLHTLSSILSVELINQALYGTIIIFLIMTIIALLLSYFNIDISWLGLYLFGALLGLIIATLLMFAIYNNNSSFNNILLIVGLVLFSVFVVYDTNIILNKNYKNNYLDASLDFYLSFVNIFVRVLALETI
jgi:FtsH-binding integral membrane protein